MKIRDALAIGLDQLRNAGVENAARDVRRLMAGALCIEPGRVTLHLSDDLEDPAEFFFFHYILARERHEPVSHILGSRAFYGRDFHVTPDVLDPRPETETLIAVALDRPFGEVLDLGTGSGCILLTLLAERPDATGIGADVSGPALVVAAGNAKALGVSDRVGLLESDWLRGVGGQFDLIVSNPPYIAADEMAGLAPELGFEPRIALTDEGDGLAAYRSIAAGLMDHLVPGGRVLLEIGPTQAVAVSTLLAEAGLEGICVHPDLDGRDRVVEAKKSV